jgi:hypothetical protein
MAGTNSDYTENKLIDTFLRNGAAYQPSALYLALFTTNPNFETGASGTEATGGSYGRKAISFGAASGGSATQSGSIVWTVGTDIAAGTYTGWAVYDAQTTGNMLFGDTFSSNKVLSGTGDTLTFNASITYSLT